MICNAKTIQKNSLNIASSGYLVHTNNSYMYWWYCNNIFSL